MPWHRSYHDANLCTGNLFRNFTDIQVAPARGAGLVLSRSYNSLDPRVGPFGVGWTHAYDIRLVEGGVDENGVELCVRKDFFGGSHQYRRDADGLYTAPPYLYDELSSEYTEALVNGGPKSDTDVSIDGTTKHFFRNGDERSCDWIRDRHGNQTTLTYDLQVTIGGVTRKLLTKVTDPSGRELTFTWSNLGSASEPIWRIAAATGPSHGVAYTYSPEGQLIAACVDPGGLNRTTTYTYTVVSGETNLLEIVNDGVGQTRYWYGLSSGLLRVTRIDEPAGLEPGTSTNRYLTTTIQVGPTPPLTVTCTIGGMEPLWLWADERFRVTRLFAGSNYAGYVYEYDDAFNLTSLKRYDNTPGRLYSRTDLYAYGFHGNLKQHSIDGFDGTETTTYYDGSRYFQKASFTDALGRTTTFGVGDRNGADPSDPSRPASPGNRGNVLWVKGPDYAQTGAKYEYAYNAYGQKISERNTNNVVTSFSYGDLWGNLTQVCQDAVGLARTTQMTYDASGRVLTSTDPQGRTAEFSHNAVGQPVAATFPATQQTPSETVGFAYDGLGRLASVTDNRGPTTIAYEPNSSRVSQVSDPLTGDLAYTYGIAGERRSMTLPGGGTWQYQYGPLPVIASDDPGALAPRLTAVVDDQGRTFQYDFDGLGNLSMVQWNIELDWGGTPARFCRTTLTAERDATGIASRGFLSQVRNTYHWRSGLGQDQVKVLTQNDYLYDAAGMRTSNVVFVDGQGARTEQYGYDVLSRLTAVSYGDGVTQSYTFDNMGNRLTKTEGGTTETYGYNAANMLVSRNEQPYVNDLNGNTLSGGGRVNTWDSQNRLVQCVSGGNTSQFVYGADGLRRTSIVNGDPVHYVLDNGMMVREMVPSGQTLIPKATYLIGPRGPEYRRDDQTQALRWYCYDGLGSVLAEVDSAGNLTASRKYDVYGLVRAGAGGTSKHKFVGSLGHTSEDDTGLIYMRARWMDPSLGRFISEDPARDGANWFEYCRGNPVNAVDASGEAPEWPDYQQFLYGLGWVLVVGAFLAAQARHFVVSQCLANGAIISFGLSAAGMLGHDLDVLSQSISTLLPVVTTMIAGAYASARTSMPFTRALSITAFGYGLLVLAFVLATDPDL